MIEGIKNGQYPDWDIVFENSKIVDIDVKRKCTNCDAQTKHIDYYEDILYVSENFTSFNLNCNGEVIVDDFQNITLNTHHRLHCAKCNGLLRLDQYKAGRLQKVQNNRKINGVKYNELSPKDMLIYCLEHKRCDYL